MTEIASKSVTTFKKMVDTNRWIHIPELHYIERELADKTKAKGTQGEEDTVTEASKKRKSDMMVDSDRSVDSN